MCPFVLKSNIFSQIGTQLFQSPSNNPFCCRGRCCILKFQYRSHYLSWMDLLYQNTGAIKQPHRHLFSLFSFPNNDLWVHSGNSRRDQADSGPVGSPPFSACLPESCCPFRLQLHFHFKQLIVVALPRGPQEETFKALPFCSFYGPQTMAPLLGPLCQQELDTTVLCYLLFFSFLGSSSQ